LLYVGPFNSPHVGDLAIAMRGRGHVVHVGGQVWEGVPDVALARHGIPTSPMSAPSILWMRRLIADVRPDVVHSHWIPFAALAAMAGARPLVVTAWGSDVYAAGRRRRLEARFGLRRASLATADSADLLARLEKLGPASLRTLLVNWGVDLDVFRIPTQQERHELKARIGLGPGPVVLSPRGVKEIYNPAVVVGAFARARAKIPDLQLVLKHSDDAVVPPEWSRAPGVHLVGAVDADQMRDLFQAAELTVSIAASDSSPRSVWEAMACGSAAIVSDLPWVHELIVDGRHAAVVEPRPAAVAAAIERLLLGESERWRIVKAARELVERHRNRAVELSRIERCYRELAAAGRD
jgi:glycosyltransferase involved in cell wall biosynthesis